MSPALLVGYVLSEGDVFIAAGLGGLVLLLWAWSVFASDDDDSYGSSDDDLDLEGWTFETVDVEDLL